MMLILQPLYVTAVFFDRMVMPRSRSRLFESIMRSSVACEGPSVNVSITAHNITLPTIQQL